MVSARLKPCRFGIHFASSIWTYCLCRQARGVAPGDFTKINSPPLVRRRKITTLTKMLSMQLRHERSFQLLRHKCKHVLDVAEASVSADISAKEVDIMDLGVALDRACAALAAEVACNLQLQQLQMQ